MNKKKILILSVVLLSMILVIAVLSLTNKPVEEIGQIVEEGFEPQRIEAEVEEEDTEEVEHVVEVEVDSSEEYKEKLEVIQVETPTIKQEVYAEINNPSGMIQTVSNRIINKQFNGEDEGYFLDELMEDLAVVVNLESMIADDYNGITIQNQPIFSRNDYDRSADLELHFTKILDPVLYIKTFSKLVNWESEFPEKDQMLLVQDWTSEFLYPMEIEIHQSIEVDAVSMFYQFKNTNLNSTYTYTVFSYEEYPDMRYGVFMVHRRIPDFESFIEKIVRVDENNMLLKEESNPMYFQADKISEKFKKILKPITK